MPSPPIFIATHDADRYRQLLTEKIGSEVAIGLAESKEEVISNYGNEPIVLGRPDFLAELLVTEPPVKWLQSTWAGVTPLIHLPFRGYQLTGVKGVFGTQMAEYVLGHVLAHELRLTDRRIAQHEKRWDQTSSGRLAGKTMGIMGTGSIGADVAQMALRLGVRVLGFNSSGKPVEPFERVYSCESVSAFLRQCDYVVGILPDIAATTDIISTEALATMKDTALIVNVGRGNLIDESALCVALESGEIGGAVLDVFKTEPLPQDSPIWEAPDCNITGHVAAVSHPEDIAGLFLENYKLYRDGAELLHRVDFEKGY